jgi:glycosyltransferase involved in cell wall biosynthesis
MNRLLLDLTHTSHTRAHTGVQRVCRSLHLALRQRQGDQILPLCHDGYENTWRPLRAWERRNLAPPRGATAGARGSRWPLSAQLAGHLRRLLAARPSPESPPAPLGGSLIEPEVFSAGVGRALPGLLARVSGPRVAVFHDAIALKLPELSPLKTVTRFPVYLQELLGFDGVAAVSEDSRQSLVEYWQWLGVERPPPVIVLSLGLEPPLPSPYGHTTAPNATPVVLSVGSIEGRKNHLALLEACETLWQRGLHFELRLVGLAHPDTGRAAVARLRALQAAGRPVHDEGPVSETGLHDAYRSCLFTVYPSLVEGFGLPVLESLSHGKPCICSSHGALGESARGGGCLALDRVDPPALARAIGNLLSDPERLEALEHAARERTFKPWSAFADELTAWMQTLARRA